MPIYKYSRHEIDERRAMRRHRRMRLVALVISGLLVSGTLVLVFGHTLAERVAKLPVQAVRAVPDAAASAVVRGR